MTSLILHHTGGLTDMVRRSFLSIFEHGRTADLLGATVLAWFAICLTFPGDTLANQGFKTFRIMGLDEIMIAVPLARS